MQKLIEDLYYGEIHPWETLNDDPEQYRIAAGALEASRITLDEKLNPEQLAALEAYLAADMGVSGIEIPQTFVNGFRLGAGLMLEMLTP